MATYDELSVADKQKVDEFVNPLRMVIQHFSRVIDHVQNGLMPKWTGNVETVIASLDANAVVPDKSTIVDSEPLTKEEIANLVVFLSAVASAETGFGSAYHQSLYVKAGGVVEHLG